MNQSLSSRAVNICVTLPTFFSGLRVLVNLNLLFRQSSETISRSPTDWVLFLQGKKAGLVGFLGTVSGHGEIAVAFMMSCPLSVSLQSKEVDTSRANLYSQSY